VLLVVSFALFGARLDVQHAVSKKMDAVLYDRRASPPLPTGDGWRAAADAVCDDAACPLLRPARLRAARCAPLGLPMFAPPPVACPVDLPLADGSVVFVKTDVALRYLQVEAAAVAAGLRRPRQVVVSHNGDLPFTAAHAATLSRCPHVAAFFAQNIDADAGHPRLHALPIGVENRQYRTGSVPAVFTRLPADANWGWRMAVARYIAAGVTSGDAVAPDWLARIGASPLVLVALTLSTNPAARLAAVHAFAVTGAATVQVPELAQEGLDLPSASPWYTDGRAVAAALQGWAPSLAARSPPLSLAAAAADLAAAVGDRGGMPPDVVAELAAVQSPDTAAKLQAYFGSMARHIFVASPPGNGAQAHRTWEAALAGAPPPPAAPRRLAGRRAAGLPSILGRDWSDATPVALLGALLRMLVADANTAAAAAPGGTPGVEWDPRLALVPPHALTAEQADHLARSVFSRDRLTGAYWQARIDEARPPPVALPPFL